MRRIILLFFGILFYSNIWADCEITIVGKIVQVPNPCLDSPCLPGIVYAIENDTSVFIISIGKKWLWADQSLIINNTTLETNDSVAIIGNINCAKDINLDKYYEIEVSSSYALTTSIENEENPLKDVQVYPNPCDSYLNIILKPNVSEKSFIQLFNSSGQLKFENNTSTELTIDMNNYEKGIYFLRIDNGKISDIKIIKK